jgi:hypothetical protein
LTLHAVAFIDMRSGDYSSHGKALFVLRQQCTNK